MDKEYYVYIYLDLEKSGVYEFGDLRLLQEPFYIGKGLGNRYVKHQTDCFCISRKSMYNTLFYNKLRKILKTGAEYDVIIYKKNLTEDEALNLEISLISKIGRRIDKTGPLCNSTMGGEGVSGYRKISYPIISYNREGKKIREYKSIIEASNKTGIDIKIIYKQCGRNKRNSLKDIRFRKKDENIEKLEDITNRKAKIFKKVYQFNIDGNFIKEWKNSREVERILNIKRSLIESYCISSQKKSINFIWLYNKKQIKQILKNKKL